MKIGFVNISNGNPLAEDRLRSSSLVAHALCLALLPFTTVSFIHNNPRSIGRNGRPSLHENQSTTGSRSALYSIVEVSSIGFEDVLYSIQNTANSLASMSLKDGDPSNLVSSLPIMYGAGLLTSASPCVWGLLPLTMSYISQAAGERADHKTTLPALAFAAGLATVFCTLGVAAVELGGVFGSSNSNGNSGLVLSMISNSICLVMGLKLLDLINIRLPTFARETFMSLSTTVTSVSNFGGSGGTFGSSGSGAPALILLDATGRIMSEEELRSKKDVGSEQNDDAGKKESGSLLRTFLLGGSSALVASPCASTYSLSLVCLY
jgi:cytochrome c biogenesis protein CcdA